MLHTNLLAKVKYFWAGFKIISPIYFCAFQKSPYLKIKWCDKSDIV